MKDRILVMPHVWISTFVDLVGAYYDDDHPCGGSCHVWLDDGNWQLPHVQACLVEALAHDDRAGATIAFLGTLMTDEARKWFEEQYTMDDGVPNLPPWSREMSRWLRGKQ